MSFIHLHVHSHYSLLDGLSKIDELVQAAKAQNMPALALTDHGNLYGLIEFYEKCKAAGIKPILGCEVYIAPNGMHNKRPKVDERPNHLILLAENLEGYQNLLKLITLANLEGFYYKPRLDLETIEQYSKGLIALSACLNGELAKAAVNHGYTKAKSILEQYLKIFGPKNFILEVQHHPTIPEQAQANEIIFKLAAEFNLQAVATNDVHYLNPEDAEAQDILVCIQTKKLLTDKDRLSMQGEDFSFKSAEEMLAAFPDHPEVISNTQIIADRCQVDIRLGEIQLPHYALPEGVTPEQELRRLCLDGLKLRFPEPRDPKILERLEYELKIIEKTGYASYFLIVQDFVTWSKNNGVVVGPGRGSAAGSLVAYLTQITNLDPLKWDLLFERFLNPERISMPDIDMDFADTRRADVIKYVEHKYGKDHVAQIITFGTMAARAAVRDVGRVLGLSYSYCDRIAKLIPMFSDLATALNDVPELKAIYDEDADAQRLLERAKKLEGVARHSSVHACGVLITKNPLNQHVPVQYAAQEDQSIVSQYSLHPIEDLGLLKMDFLGLKNLTIIENTLHIIEKTTGQHLNINDIPTQDKPTFKLLKQGQTTGVFQLESSGMKRYLRELKPTEFEDIIAMVALYRPGPMEWIPEYIRGKHGKHKPEYLHPKLEPILGKTYGVAIYQEQLMQIARDLAGFTLGEADVLRKAVGKKIAKLLNEQKHKFISGCVAHGIKESIAKQIFDFIEPFAGYGFNRSHAACYALIAYQTAYLKANFPAQFMAALLTSDYGDTERIAIEVTECRNQGIDVLPPDINESFSTFTVVKESVAVQKPRIRFGLAAIKNVGEHIVRIIIDERKANGAYNNLEDFLSRVQDKDLNKKSLESLIKSGALDIFGSRAQLLGNLENLLNYVRLYQQERASGQKNLFGQLPVTHAPHLKLETYPEIALREKLHWEKELLGLYVSAHPLQDYQLLFNCLGTPIIELKNFLKGSPLVKVFAIITTVKKIYTRKNEPMLFVRIEDGTGETEAIVFPKVLAETLDLWQEDKIIVLEGKVNDKDGQIKILVERAKLFALENLAERAVIVNLPEKISKTAMEKMKAILTQYPGTHAVYLANQQTKIDTKMCVTADALPELQGLFGKNSIKLV